MHINKPDYYNNLDKTKNKNFFEKIYTIGNLKKVQLLDENNFFVLYEIDVINKIIPDINDTNFKNEITNKLSNKKMFEFNNDLIKKINTNNFSSKSFQDLTKSGDSKIGKIILESINDDAKFTNESIKIIYSLPKNNYALVLDNDKNIYIINVVNIINKNISKDSNDYLNYNTQANIKTRDNMYSSYDLLLNERYKIKINQKVLDRIKNYFR